ncbi:MAG: VPA1262 family N-terminal domain-containing protein [Undibacterium umbellatum]|uniref:VPA1262 family N-terminal domain-containing protein n=1 Tax=Undibacterium umbellatum TaxID=2762300 RepID=UPI003BB66AC8
MDRSKRKGNMLNAITVLKELLEPGLLGHYSWFEAVEVIAFIDVPGTKQKRVVNIFSIYIAESGEQPGKPENDFLSKKSKKIKELEGWSFRVTKRPVDVDELLACVERYARTDIWTPPGQEPLEVGNLVAAPALFCPPDARTEIPLNAVLKNNFWSGSYVVELKDESKATLVDLVKEDCIFEELSEWLTGMLPLNIARVPDRIGDVLFQIPANALIAEIRHAYDMPVALCLAWNPSITQRKVIGEYRVEQDGLIASLERFEFPVGTGHLNVPPTSGDLRFSVWDAEKERLLAATATICDSGRKWRIESSTSTLMDHPRRFSVKGATNAIDIQEIPLMEPAGGWKGRWQPMRHDDIDWRARRELKAKMKQLVESRKFVQYGIDNTPPQDEHRRALEDLRHLIRHVNQGAIYLWDPYLSSNDILNTLAFCGDTGTDLWGLTSAKPSKMGWASDDCGDSPANVSSTDRETWIIKQRDILDTAFIGPSHMKLEFRMSWDIQGSFHDRFLIFPGLGRSRTRVWSLGASVNHIGAQHCIVQEVAYPEPVLQAFKTFWEQSGQPEHLIWKYS